MTNKDPLPLNGFITYRMARVQAKLNTQGARLLKEVAGLTLAQWRILLVLKSEGPFNSSELSRHAQIDKGLLSRKLKTLIDAGYVDATPHPTDRRVQTLSLTEAGIEKFEVTVPHMRARQQRLRALLSPNELDLLFEMLQRIEDALDKEAKE